MKTLNKYVLDLTVAILDFLYRGRDYQRFWVLEEIARAPYFAFLSVLHFRESMGLRGPEHLYLMKEHFDQSVNETEHLEYMESRGGNAYFIDRFVAKHLVLIYYWVNVVYYWLGSSVCIPSVLRSRVHAATTYAKYLAYNGEDEKILEILNDELQHAHELHKAIKLIA